MSQQVVAEFVGNREALAVRVRALFDLDHHPLPEQPPTESLPSGHGLNHKPIGTRHSLYVYRRFSYPLFSQDFPGPQPAQLLAHSLPLPVRILGPPVIR